MHTCVLEKHDLQPFDSLVSQLTPSIRRQVEPFTRDGMLGRVEDSDSLYNIALLKLAEATQNFVYDITLCEEHNEHRFLAMVNLYIRNEMIDRQYAANVDKRKPKGHLFSLTGMVRDDTDEHEHDYYADVEDESYSVIDSIVAIEFDDWIRHKMTDEETTVYAMLCQGWGAEKIAGKMGIATSRVRYIIYEKIQERAKRYA